MRDGPGFKEVVVISALCPVCWHFNLTTRGAPQEIMLCPKCGSTFDREGKVEWTTDRIIIGKTEGALTVGFKCTYYCTAVCPNCNVAFTEYSPELPTKVTCTECGTVFGNDGKAI